MSVINGLRVLLVSAILFGMVQNAAGQSSAKTEVLAALAERDKAFVAGDEAKVAQFMSEDYLQTDVNGNVQDKQTWLNEYYQPMAPLLRSGKTRWVTFDRSDIVVRDLGDTVIVAGKQTIKHIGAEPWNPSDITPLDSPRPPLTLRFTHVWIKRDGAWKLAVVHNAIPRERQVAQTAENARLPVQMRIIADTLAGVWSVTWADKDGNSIGEGEEVWKVASGTTAFTEENRSMVKGESADDYASMWWDGKAQKVHGIWCDRSINDEGCSGFDVTLEASDVVLTGEWEFQRKRRTWREVFSITGASMTQTLYVGEPGKELKLATTILGKKR